MLELLKDRPRAATIVWWMIIGGPIAIAVAVGMAGSTDTRMTLTTFAMGMCIYAVFVGVAFLQPPVRAWTVAMVMVLGVVVGAAGATMLSFAQSLPLDDRVASTTTTSVSDK